ncbi:MAG: TIGR03758 family integrating conjugative element protein [Gammaproteobacteria bacterium]|nr:TIGR03758 family integrating conjugative element protein [Gammaproteobacteria bacterium]
MTAQQRLAFEAGSGVTPEALLLAIAGITLSLAFLWVTWIAFGTFKAWQDGNASFFDLVWNVLRASIVLLVLGFYVR